jgi:hypothetical protein
MRSHYSNDIESSKKQRVYCAEEKIAEREGAT